MYIEEKKNGSLEKWVDIIGYEDRYMVSSLGRVRGVRSNKYLKCHMLGNYLSISLSIDQHNRKSARIHQLVATHFIKNDDPKNKTIIHHIDGNKLNNKVTNLRWVNQSENILHYNNNHKPKFIKPILQYDLHGNLIKEWVNIKEICSETLYNSSQLYQCLNKKINTSYGFKWKYKDDKKI